MSRLVVLFVALASPAYAQDEAETEADDEVEDFEGITLPVTKGLKGDTVKGEAIPAGTRMGEKVLTEDGQEIAFIDLDPKEETALLPAWTIAAIFGGGMLTLGVLASLLLLRSASTDEPS